MLSRQGKPKIWLGSFVKPSSIILQAVNRFILSSSLCNKKINVKKGGGGMNIIREIR